jgi:hypothetical protein
VRRRIQAGKRRPSEIVLSLVPPSTGAKPNGSQASGQKRKRTRFDFGNHYERRLEFLIRSVECDRRSVDKYRLGYFFVHDLRDIRFPRSGSSKKRFLS